MLRTSCRSARSSALPYHSGRYKSATGRRSRRRFPLRSALFPQTGDDRLLFGGREIYGVNDPKDIHIHIRRQISESIPTEGYRITHGWGGYVGITVPRRPFVREVMPNVISAGGYSGHGVMLSNFFGKLYAETSPATAIG